MKEHCSCRTRMWEMEPHSDLKTLHSLILSAVVTLEQGLKKDCQHVCLFTITFLPSFTEIADFLISSGRNHSGRILSFIMNCLHQTYIHLSDDWAFLFCPN